MKNNFGQYLRKVREKRKFSLRDVAKQCNVDYGCLSRLERGKNKPSFVAAVQLSVVYKITLDEMAIELIKELV